MPLISVLKPNTLQSHNLHTRGRILIHFLLTKICVRFLAINFANSSAPRHGKEGAKVGKAYK